MNVMFPIDKHDIKIHYWKDDEYKKLQLCKRAVIGLHVKDVRGTSEAHEGAGAGMVQRGPEHLMIIPGSKTLHREAKRIKFNRTMIIGGKLGNGYKVLNNIRSNKHIIKVNGPGKTVLPVEVTSKVVPLPT
jgi:hypothetical protein